MADHSVFTPSSKRARGTSTGIETVFERACHREMCIGASADDNEVLLLARPGETYFGQIVKRHFIVCGYKNERALFTHSLNFVSVLEESQQKTLLVCERCVPNDLIEPILTN